jgi:hypothetical protein
MGEPRLTIVGVYSPAISAETWQEQWQVTADDDQRREHFDNLVLIEAIAEGLDEPFNMGKFGQMQAEFPDDPRRMQVGYDEVPLSLYGEMLIQRRMNCVEGTGPFRFAAYLHLYDPQRPLLWQQGEVVSSGGRHPGPFVIAHALQRLQLGQCLPHAPAYKSRSSERLTVIKFSCETCAPN